MSPRMGSYDIDIEKADDVLHALTHSLKLS